MSGELTARLPSFQYRLLVPERTPISLPPAFSACEPDEP
jgi:hypothetical protein